jgi:hypothetical protein
MRGQNLKRKKGSLYTNDDTGRREEKKGSLYANDDTGRREETFKTVLRSSFLQTKRALEPVKEEAHEAKEIATPSVPMNEPNRR